MTETPQIESAKGRNITAWIGCGTIICIILLPFVLLIARGLFVFTGNSQIDDDDLIYVRTEHLAAESNAFTYLIEATNYLYWPEGVWRGLHADYWNAETGTVVAVSNEQSLVLIDLAIELGRIQFPNNVTYTSRVEYIMPMRDIGRMMATRAEYLRRKGQYADAMEQSLRCAELGTMMCRGEGAMLHYIIGSVVRRYGLEQVELLLSEHQLSHLNLAGIQDRLLAGAADTNAFCLVWKMEYTASSSEIERIAAGATDGMMKNALNGVHIPDGAVRALLPLSFDPAETKGLFAENARLMISLSSTNQSYVSGAFGGTYPYWPQGGKEMCMAILAGNLLGRGLAAVSVAGTAHALKFKNRMDAKVYGIALVIAIRRFEADAGVQISKLPDLVPKYIDAVPADPFDGKPMRYSSSNRTVYSVSKDFIDSGGARNPSTNLLSTISSDRTPDMVFHIDPTTPAP